MINETQDPRHARRPKTYYRVSDGALAIDVSFDVRRVRYRRSEAGEMLVTRRDVFEKTHREAAR
jgi:hypothetical protein